MKELDVLPIEERLLIMHCCQTIAEVIALLEMRILEKRILEKRILEKKLSP